MDKQRRHKFQLYRQLQLASAQIYADAQVAAGELGLSAEDRGAIGLTGAVSNCHALLTRHVSAAIDAGSRKVINNATLDERVREIVKDFYGDDWDAAVTNTCEAALWVTIDTLFAPPIAGRGDSYRCRYIAPYEQHLHHQGGYGRPFPPRYKDLFADRGTTAGELGFLGKRQNDLDVVFVRLPGARYDCHGIKYHPVPLLTQVDAASAADAISEAANRHADSLVGFTSLGYDTPGYGYGEKDSSGAPKLQRLIGDVSRKWDVPYLVDNAWGLPFIGTDPRKIGADVMVFSMDKAAGAPTAGLIIGREEAMVPIRRTLGIHGDRWGTGASHGKAAYAGNDPGKEALLGVIATLEAMSVGSELFNQTLDDLNVIVNEEFSALPSELQEGWTLTKSVNSCAIELNYENTWHDRPFGFPIFSIEDMYAGTNLLQSGMTQMGFVPTIAYDANIFISPGLGTTDEDGRLIEVKTRLACRALMRLIQIVGKNAGLLDDETFAVAFADGKLA
jgi:hypothetical protein